MNRTFLAGALRACWAPLGRRATRPYVAGPALPDALRACRRVGARGLASSLGYWNRDDDGPALVAQTCVAALRGVARERLDASLSIKAAALGMSHEVLAGVLEESRRLAIPVHFDAQRPATVDPTFALIAGTPSDRPALGCTLPARWRRSLTDVEQVLELGLRVRIVKGEESDAPGAEMDPRAGFLALVDRLAGRASHVSVATHDTALAREALRRLRAARTSCELELLFGFPLWRVVSAARAVQVRVRLYVPYGHAWLPYRLSTASERPAVLWWTVRDLLFGRALRAPELFPPFFRSPVTPEPVAAEPALSEYQR